MGYVLSKLQTSVDYQCCIYDWFYCYFFASRHSTHKFQSNLFNYHVTPLERTFETWTYAALPEQYIVETNYCFRNLNPFGTLGYSLPGACFVWFSLIYFIHLFNPSPVRANKELLSYCCNVLMLLKSIDVFLCYFVCCIYINFCLAVLTLPEIYTWFFVYYCVDFKPFAYFRNGFYFNIPS